MSFALCRKSMKKLAGHLPKDADKSQPFKASRVWKRCVKPRKLWQVHPTQATNEKRQSVQLGTTRCKGAICRFVLLQFAESCVSISAGLCVSGMNFAGRIFTLCMQQSLPMENFGVWSMICVNW